MAIAGNKMNLNKIALDLIVRRFGWQLQTFALTVAGEWLK